METSVNKAIRLMKAANPRALIAMEGEFAVMIEDVLDDKLPQGKLYRIEYKSTPDANHSAAYCVWWPHGPITTIPAAHVHLRDGRGWICIGHGASSVVTDSSIDLDVCIKRARYWVMAMSYFKQTGQFLNP